MGITFHGLIAGLSDPAALWGMTSDLLRAITVLDVMEFFFVSMSVVGQSYISKRDIKGFYFWVAGNLVALVVFATIQRWMTFCLYGYFTWMSMRGIKTWRQLDQEKHVQLQEELTLVR